MKKERTPSLDLLRIISMLMVICNHLISWSGILPDEAYAMTPMWLAKEVFFVFLQPAVNCFVLISGYFLCTARFKLKKLVSLWVQTLFYSIGIYLLVCLSCDGIPFSFSVFLKRCLPVTTTHYWFITAYILMYILFPFMNTLIHAMDKSKHLMCCLVLFGVFSVAANLMYISDFSGVYGGYSFIWFCVIYIAAAYIRLYVPARVKHQKWMFPLSGVLCLAICAEKFLAHLITPYIFGSLVLDGFFYSYNSILAVPCALTLFQGFRGLTIRSPRAIKVIGLFAPLTLAAYLIHGNMSFSQILLDAVNVSAHCGSFVLFPYLILCTICIFLVSSGIEWIRQWLFGVLQISSRIERICDVLQETVALRLHRDDPSA